MQKLRKYTLDNGLRVLIEKVPFSKEVAFLTGVKVGSIHEEDKTDGASHFNEHLLFKTNQYRTTKEILRYLEWNGIMVNAYTDVDHTSFWTRSLSKNLPKAVEIIFQAATNFQYNQNDFNNEKNVVIDELKMREDDPSSYLVDQTQSTLFKSTPLERNVNGTIDSLTNLAKQELEELKKTFYVPNNIVLVGVGEFDEKNFLDTVDSTFGKLKTKKVKHPNLKKISLKNQGQKILIEKESMELAYLTLAYKIPGATVDFDDYQTFGLLNTLLGDGMSSRIFNGLREEKGIGYCVGSSLENFGPIAIETIYVAGYSPKRFDETVETIENIIKDLQRKAISDKELKGVKEFLMFNTNSTIARETNRANLWLSKEMGRFPKELNLDNYLDYITKITKKDILRVANKYLCGNYQLINVSPRQ